MSVKIKILEEEKHLIQEAIYEVLSTKKFINLNQKISKAIIGCIKKDIFFDNSSIEIFVGCLLDHYRYKDDL